MLINENPSLIAIKNTFNIIKITRTIKKTNAITKNITKKKSDYNMRIASFFGFPQC